ncbi:hypothetical protein BGX33_010215, partial [Mortierella sp. NVP41]
MQFSTIISLAVVASMTILSTMAAPAAPVCNKACNKMYKPVCAKLLSGETMTFGNACALDVFKCENPKEKAELVANAECPAIKPTCPKACPLNYSPICAKLKSGETKTFSNGCEMSVYNCENPTEKAEVIANAECPAAP